MPPHWPQCGAMPPVGVELGVETGVDAIVVVDTVVVEDTVVLPTVDVDVPLEGVRAGVVHGAHCAFGTANEYAPAVSVMFVFVD